MSAFITGAALVAGGIAVSAYSANKASKRQAASNNRAIDASTYQAELADQLGRDELAFAKEQYADNKVLATRVADAQVQGMDENNARARDYYEYESETYRPLEQGLVRDAEEYSTEAKREQLAGTAAADAGRAFANTQAMTNRGLSSMGVNPNSGKALAMANQNSLGLAASRAGAMNNSRVQSDALGWAKRLDAAGLGRNLAGASTAAYQTAGGLGNSAVQNTMAPGNSALQGMNQGNNRILSGAAAQTNTMLGLTGQSDPMAQFGMALGGKMTSVGLGMAGM